MKKLWTRNHFTGCSPIKHYIYAINTKFDIINMKDLKLYNQHGDR